MTPGLAFFYGGLAKKNGVLTIMMQSFVAMGCITILWMIVGFSLAFGKSAGGVIGNPWTFMFYRNVNANELTLDGCTVDVDASCSATAGASLPGILFAGYQGMFAVITPALMTGAFLDRVNFGPYITFISLWLLVVYCPACHWVWTEDGFLAVWGVKDFAGGLVVHVTAGFSALASLVVVGRRATHDIELDLPHNVPHVLLGTALLWFGWFGFNAGSALSASSTSAYAAINSELAGSVSLFVWTLIDWYRCGKPSLVGACVGAIAGLATVTPAAGFIEPWAAFVIGIIAAVFCYSCAELAKRNNWDDALDVWACHGIGGFTGTLLIGAFASEAVGGFGPSWELFGKQLAAALLIGAYSSIVTILLLKGIDFATGGHLSPTQEQIDEGLDNIIHGEEACVRERSAKATQA